MEKMIHELDSDEKELLDIFVQKKNKEMMIAENSDDESDDGSDYEDAPLLPSYNQTYYQKNKDKILNRMKEKIPCSVCGKMITRQHMPRHKTTSSCRINSFSLPRRLDIIHPIAVNANRIRVLEENVEKLQQLLYAKNIDN